MDSRVAEVAAEHWLWDNGVVQTHRVRRSRFGKQDIFGADVVGKTADFTYYVQVTTGGSSSVAHRRRILEGIAWCWTDVVVLLEVRRVGKQDFFRVHRYYYGLPNVHWEVEPELVPIQKEWRLARVRGAAPPEP